MYCCEPKERIVNAALELFGEKGFKATTIREICKKADVSLALVNYHFRNKKTLYDEIVQATINEAFDAVSVTDFIKEEMSAEEKLKNAIRLILHRMIGPKGLGNSPAKVRIVLMEMTNPTDTMEKIFEKHISKIIMLISSIVRELTGEVEQEKVIRFVSSIAGQCMHPLFAKEILAKSGLTIKSTDEDIEKHAEHIYQFSLNGIMNYYGEKR